MLCLVCVFLTLLLPGKWKWAQKLKQEAVTAWPPKSGDLQLVLVMKTTDWTKRLFKHPVKLILNQSKYCGQSTSFPIQIHRTLLGSFLFRGTIWDFQKRSIIIDVSSCWVNCSQYSVACSVDEGSLLHLVCCLFKLTLAGVAHCRCYRWAE